MLKWRIKRTVDLSGDAPDVERLKALATMSTRIAHELRIGVQENKKDAEISGLAVKLSVILPDKSSLMDTFDGTINGNEAVVTLPDICYSQKGEVKGVLYLVDDAGGMLPIYAFVLRNFEDLTDIFVDIANVVPSIAELLAQIQTMRQVTADAQAAANHATTAAQRAEDLQMDATGMAGDSNRLGGKAPEYYLQPFDYLQNDDFTNAVNQRGFTSDTPASGYPYVADRWYANGNGSTYAVSDDGLTLDASGVSVNASVSHVIERMLDDGEYTIIEYDKSGTPIGRVTRSVSGISATYLSHEYGSGYYITFAYNDAKARFYAQVVAYSGQSHTVASLRMFKGAYTLETAPPYVPKGYAAELAECLRYYRVYATQDARPSHGRDCSPPMRLDAPTQGTLSIGDATYYYNSAEL